MRRVVVTGIGLLSPLGLSYGETLNAVRTGASGIRTVPEWSEYQGLRTRLGATLPTFQPPAQFTHKQVRSMSRNALVATMATEQALGSAGLLGADLLRGGRVGIAYGSGIGSPEAVGNFCNFLYHKSIRGVSATSYHRMMSHTAAANIGIVFGITGRLIPSSSACTSGSQAIGFAYETIKYGIQDIMIAGGSEELAPAIAAVFDVLFACSVQNDSPTTTPRPFDLTRDGMVVGEGACSLILEEREHALRRGSPILAEVVGFGTNADGFHITNPNPVTMEQAIRLALNDAQIGPEAIEYINAHGTGTIVGDIAESHATAAVFGGDVPFSSLKGHLGHLLGACGAAELALTIGMMTEGWLVPTRNLRTIDDRCANLDYVVGANRDVSIRTAISTTFAFGGVNTAIVIRRV